MGSWSLMDRHRGGVPVIEADSAPAAGQAGRIRAACRSSAPNEQIMGGAGGAETDAMAPAPEAPDPQALRAQTVQRTAPPPADAARAQPTPTPARRAIPRRRQPRASRPLPDTPAPRTAARPAARRAPGLHRRHHDPTRRGRHRGRREDGMAAPRQADARPARRAATRSCSGPSGTASRSGASASAASPTPPRQPASAPASAAKGGACSLATF